MVIGATTMEPPYFGWFAAVLVVAVVVPVAGEVSGALLAHAPTSMLTTARRHTTINKNLLFI